MQEDLETIFKWARNNRMKFNESKFEQMAHGSLKTVTLDPYKTQCGEDIQIKDTAKDLGILATNDPGVPHPADSCQDLIFLQNPAKSCKSCEILQNVLQILHFAVVAGFYYL